MAMTREEFAAAYGPHAQRVAAQLNVPADGVLNHWGLETGWGKHVIPGTNNLGNIKDFSGGGVGAVDNMTRKRDSYRVYGSPGEFADDYAKLIGKNPRYAAALNTQTAYDFANGLQRGGYAEDPNFARKVAGMPNHEYQQQPPSSGANLKSTQVPADDMASLKEIARFKSSLLPIALGAMISSNRGSQNMGNALYKDAMEGVDPVRIGRGMILPSGKYISEQSDLDILRQMKLGEDVERQRLENSPADMVQAPGGQQIDPNAPWRGLTNKQAQNMRTQTMNTSNKELDGMRKEAGSYEESMQAMRQFSDLNQRNGTGGPYDNLAPDWAHLGEKSTLVALQNKLTPLQRPAGSGATSDFEQRMYKHGIPNINNQGNTNAQIRIAQEALNEVRTARLGFYEEYLSKYGHLNGAEKAFNPRIKAIESKYQPQIQYYGCVDENGHPMSAVPYAKQVAPQISNQRDAVVGSQAKSDDKFDHYMKQYGGNNGR